MLWAATGQDELIHKTTFTFPLFQGRFLRAAISDDKERIEEENKVGVYRLDFPRFPVTLALVAHAPGFLPWTWHMATRGRREIDAGRLIGYKKLD